VSAPADAGAATLAGAPGAVSSADGASASGTTAGVVSRHAAVGAGRMGRSIAVAYALAGQPCALVDLRERTPEAAARLRDEAQAEMAGILEHLVSLGLLDAAQRPAVLARIAWVDRAGAPDALAQARLIFEAVPETLDAKRDGLGVIGALAGPHVIVASTSSTMQAGELAGFLPHPERFLNAHWLNPAYLVPLVEVAPHAGTAPAVREALLADLRAAGKVPVVCNDAPGYIVPRLQVMVMNEAARMIEQGAASAEDIDLAIRYGFGIRYAAMGVAEFIDFGGLDTLFHASGYLADRLGDARYASPEIVNRKMAAGELGVKTGQGLYAWNADSAARLQAESMRRFAALLKLQGLEPAAPTA